MGSFSVFRRGRPVLLFSSGRSLCVGFFSIAVSCHSLPAQENLKNSYETAQQLFLRGEDGRARAAFGQLLVETLRERAALYRQQGVWARVQEDLEAALELAPDSAAVRSALAYAYFRQANWKQ